MFCQMGKGKRAQLYNALGVWWSASLLWHALPSPLPKSLLLRLESGTPALSTHCLPSQVSSLAQQEEAVVEMMDRLLHPTHRVLLLLLLSLLQSVQTSKITSFCSSLVRDLGFGTSPSDAGLVSFCLSHMLLPCKLILLWKLRSRNRIFVPREKLTFQD